MKKKYLASEDEYKKNGLPQENLKFFIKSPFSSINLPQNSFFAFHIPKDFVMGAQIGTAYVVRLVDDGPTRIDIDVYQNFHDSTGTNVERHGPNKALTIHQSPRLPSFMEDGIELSRDDDIQEIKKMVDEHLNAH